MQFQPQQQDISLAKLVGPPGTFDADPLRSDPLRKALLARPTPLRRRIIPDAPKEPQPASQLRADAPVFTPASASAAAPAPQVAAPEAEAPAEPENLPAVVSVKKSRKGCAVVLLRCRATQEIGVKMSVAVVDGVCVEVRPHSSRREPEEGAAPEFGLFVAWGHRVEAKASVSAEGLEAYFNALASVKLPENLDVKPPFKEACVRFPINSSVAVGLDLAPKVDSAEQDKIREGPFCARAKVEALWEAKGRLDDLWHIPPPPLARSLMTRVARAQLFPHSGEGGKEHENRAGDKLAELAEAVGLLDGVPVGSAFLDLCGGPGAWSQFLLDKPELALKGFGFTLRENAGAAGDWQAEDKDQWYEELYSRPDWRALWGADGTGDLLKPGNLEHCAKQCKQLSGNKVFLCVADGGFSDKAIPANLLELYFYRLMLGEVLMAASCLMPGGRFVCKLYTALSTATGALLYLVGRLFDSAEIVKPMSSRATGPERYLSASGFRAGAPETQAIIEALTRAHNFGNGRSPLSVPLLTPVVSAEELARDGAYMAGATAMCEGMCDRQASALAAVVDRALFLENVAMGVPVPPPCERKAVDEEEREERHHRRSYDDRSSRYQAHDAEKYGAKGKGKGKGKGKRVGRFGGA